MQTVKENLEHAEHAYGTFAVLPKTLKLKLLWQKLKKA